MKRHNVTVKLLWIIAGILILLGIRFLYEDGVLNRWIALLLTVALYFIIIRITKQKKYMKKCSCFHIQIEEYVWRYFINSILFNYKRR